VIFTAILSIKKKLKSLLKMVLKEKIRDGLYWFIVGLHDLINRFFYWLREKLV